MRKIGFGQSKFATKKSKLHMLSSEYGSLIGLVELICDWKFIIVVVLGSLLVGLEVSIK